MRNSVSFVIPTWRKNEYIETAVSSALNQRGGMPVEVIISANGPCEDWVSELKERYGGEDRVKVIWTDEKGVSAARNLALKEATGDWVCFLDDDDYLTDGFIDALISRADDDTDMVIGNIFNIDIQNDIIDKNTSYNRKTKKFGGKPVRLSSLKTKMRQAQQHILSGFANGKDAAYKIVSSGTTNLLPGELQGYLSLFITVTFRIIRRQALLSFKSDFDCRVRQGEDSFFWAKNSGQIKGKILCVIETDEAYIRRKDAGTSSVLHINKLLRRKKTDLTDERLLSFALEYIEDTNVVYECFEDSGDDAFVWLACLNILNKRVARIKSLIDHLDQKNYHALISQIRKTDIRPAVKALLKAEKLPASPVPGPLVSIIIPIRDTEKTASAAISSCEFQTYANIEIITMDGDCGQAKNAGLDAAKGEYVAFLGSDDFLEPMAIELALAEAVSKDADVLCFMSSAYDSVNGKRNYPEMDIEKDVLKHPTEGYVSKTFTYKTIPSEIFTSISLTVCGKLWKKTFIDAARLRFDDLRFGADTVFTHGAFAREAKVANLFLPLYNRRISSGEKIFDEDAAAHIIADKNMLNAAGVWEELKKTYYNWALEEIKAIASEFGDMDSWWAFSAHIRTTIFPDIGLDEKMAAGVLSSKRLNLYRRIMSDERPAFLIGDTHRRKNKIAKLKDKNAQLKLSNRRILLEKQSQSEELRATKTKLKAKQRQMDSLKYVLKRVFVLLKRNILGGAHR